MEKTQHCLRVERIAAKHTTLSKTIFVFGHAYVLGGVPNAGKLSLTATRDVIATETDTHIVYHVTLEQASRNGMRTILCVSVIFFSADKSV